MHEFLLQVAKRPGLYLGSPEQPFTRLLAFLDGYSVGYRMARKADASWPENFVPQGFRDFVCRRFGVEIDVDTKGWTTLVREHAASEQEAFSLFFRLLEDYERGL